MHLHRLLIQEALHRTLGETHVQRLPHVDVGDRVQGPPHLDVAVGPHLGPRPGGHLEGLQGQGLQGRPFHFPEMGEGLEADGPVDAFSHHLQAPPPGSGVYLRKGSKAPPLPELLLT